jgi:branched-chain amino acid transport system ATP-binding protein
VLVEIVRGINAEGTAVIWIEHVVRALTSLVSRMTCLYGGEFIGDGTPAQVLANPRVREIYFGADPDLASVEPLEALEQRDQKHE